MLIYLIHFVAAFMEKCFNIVIFVHMIVKTDVEFYQTIILCKYMYVFVYTSHLYLNIYIYIGIFHGMMIG